MLFRSERIRTRSEEKSYAKLRCCFILGSRPSHRTLVHDLSPQLVPPTTRTRSGRACPAPGGSRRRPRRSAAGDPPCGSSWGSSRRERTSSAESTAGSCTRPVWPYISSKSKQHRKSTSKMKKGNQTRNTHLQPGAAALLPGRPPSPQLLVLRGRGVLSAPLPCTCTRVSRHHRQQRRGAGRLHCRRATVGPTQDHGACKSINNKKQ